MRILIFLGIIFFAFLGGGWVYFITTPCIDVSILEQYRAGAYSVVLDDQGAELMRFQTDRRAYIPLAHIPQVLINAFVAAEDQQFFTHCGLSFRAMLRSLWVNVTRGRIVQGASTITQQLVKLLFLNSKREWGRKLREQVMALWVERQFTKEQILEIYLNHVYFGAGIYGVEAASQRFFGCSARQLTTGQAAVLAAIVRAPERRCPVASCNKARAGRDVVLRVMLRMDFISLDEYHHALAEPVAEPPLPEAPVMCHIRQMIRAWCEEQFGHDALYRGQLIIQTTINRDAQYAAYAAMRHGLGALRASRLPDVDGALIAIDYTTGEIKALIGGYDGLASAFNRASSSRRQLGSAFKPLVYGVACMHGISLNTVMIDEPTRWGSGEQTWAPRNVNKKFLGPMTLAHALMTSNNIIAIKLLEQVGIQHVMDIAKASGCTGYIPPYLSLALGTAEVSAQEAAGLYGMLAHQGTYEAPHLIVWVKDVYGNKIWRHTPSSVRVMPWAAASQIVFLLERNIKRLQTRFNYRWPNGPCMGKSGTTNDARSCWFVGAAATPKWSVAVHVGYDDYHSMGDVLSSQTALPIWTDFMSRVVPSGTTDGFQYDPRLHRVWAHRETGELWRYSEDPRTIWSTASFYEELLVR